MSVWRNPYTRSRLSIPVLRQVARLGLCELGGLLMQVVAGLSCAVILLRSGWCSVMKVFLSCCGALLR